MKKATLILAILLAVLTLCACGASQPAASPAPTAEPTPEPTAAPTTEPTAVPTPEPTAGPGAAVPADYAPDFSFSTTDRGGKVFDETIFASQKLTMINFWEPWCPPCIGEMPDLEKLYEAYADEGFLILGVYATEGMEADVDSVLEKAGTQYPILHYTAAFDRFETGYVPTTVFVDGGGHIVSAEPYVGSNSYEGWESILLETLK